MNKTDKSKSNEPGNWEWFTKLISTLIKEVGISGTVLTFMMFFMVFVATSAQKTEFIDKWVLLKGEDHFPCAIVIVSTLALCGITVVYYKRMLDLAKEENKRVGQEKSDLQQGKITKSRLSSSKKKQST
jgi:heme/copper-type cytochrome/quinol oxidase subunit 3